MRTILSGIVICAAILMALEATEAKPYFSPSNLAFQPRARYFVVEQSLTPPQLVAEVPRGGASKKKGEEEVEESDDESESEGEDSEIVSDDEDEDGEEEVEQDEYDEYDADEYDEEEDESYVTVADKGEFVEPLLLSPQVQMYALFGSFLIAKRIDMFNPIVVRVIRFLFIAQLILQQLLIIYVRIMAKKNNDRTPIQQANPLSEILKKQMDQAGGNDMVKNLASSFLSSETTVMEYDMKQASNMQGGVLFNLVLNWFLHFKMRQTQPLMTHVINSTMQLAYNPLFQVYVMGRNLERPFKTAAQKMMQEQKEAKEEEQSTEDKVLKEEEDDDDDDETEDDEESQEDEDEAAESEDEETDDEEEE